MTCEQQQQQYVTTLNELNKHRNTELDHEYNNEDYKFSLL